MGFAEDSIALFGGTQQVSTPNVIGRVGKFNVCSRGDKLSSHAGLVLLQGFMEQLQVAQVLDAQLKVKVRARGYSEAQAVQALIYNMVSGGACLSDLNVLRGDPATQQLPGVASILAPTTAGEFLRKFDMGDIRDLARVNRLLQERVRPQQTASTVQRGQHGQHGQRGQRGQHGQHGQHGHECTMDLDSSIYEQASRRKQGSTKAYNGEIGYHPLLAFWDEQEGLLFSHLRRGSAHSATKVLWFLEETIKRLPSASIHHKAVKLRADSGFYDKAVVAWCEAHHITFAITADQTAPLIARIEALDESAWQDLEKYGVAQVAELRYQPARWPQPYRYVVKRELAQSKKGELYFRYHVLVTNNEQDSATTVLTWHLAHANMENRIKEHKSGFALEKFPTHSFHANWAYLLLGQLAFNLVAWFKRLVLPQQYQHATIKTIRQHVLKLAGKIVCTSRQHFLILCDQYRYQDVWRFALERLTALKAA